MAPAEPEGSERPQIQRGLRPTSAARLRLFSPASNFRFCGISDPPHFSRPCLNPLPLCAGQPTCPSGPVCGVRLWGAPHLLRKAAAPPSWPGASQWSGTGGEPLSPGLGGARAAFLREGRDSPPLCPGALELPPRAPLWPVIHHAGHGAGLTLPVTRTQRTPFCKPVAHGAQPGEVPQLLRSRPVSSPSSRL